MHVYEAGRSSLVMNSSAAKPIEKTVVLVGAGNAHLVFVRRWMMRPMPGVAVTLVNEAATVPYSAMVPAHIGGEYPLDDITIDLVRLCQSAKVRFVAERATGVDPVGRRVLFADRPPLVYDVLSLGLGSLPALPDDAADRCVDYPAAARQSAATDRRAWKNGWPSIQGRFIWWSSAAGRAVVNWPWPFTSDLGRHPGFRLTLLQGTCAPAAGVSRRGRAGF